MSSITQGICGQVAFKFSAAQGIESVKLLETGHGCHSSFIYTLYPTRI